MTPTVVERRPIDFPNFADRFSTAPVTKPVSGRPAAPPVEEKPRTRYHERHQPPVAVRVAPAKVARRAAPQQTGPHARNPNSNGFTPSRISIDACPDGQPHEWHSSGKRQDVCARCPRTRMKTNVPEALRTTPRVKRPPIVLAFPERWGQCPKAAEHRLVYGGWKGGKPDAICLRCRKQGQRLMYAGEVKP